MVGGFDLLLKAIDVALDLRKIGLTILGTFVIGIATAPFGVGGTFLAGAGMADAFSNMFSSRSSSSGNVMVLLGGCLFFIAVLIGFVLSMILLGALSRMAYADLSGNFRSGMMDGIQFAFRHALSLIFSPIMLVIAAIALFVVEIILFLPGRIQEVGILWVACLSLPVLIINMALILLLLFGVLLIPAIVAVESTNAMATLTTMMNLVRRAPGRLIGYWMIATPLILIVLAVLFYVFSTAATTTLTLAVVGGGAGSGLNINPTASNPLDALSPLFRSSPTGRSGMGSFAVATMIMGFGVSIIFTVVLTFVLVVLPTSVSCAIYMNVRA